MTSLLRKPRRLAPTPLLRQTRHVRRDRERVQTELLRGVRRESRARALALVDERPFLYGVRGAFSSSSSAAGDGAVRIAAIGRLRRRSQPASRTRARAAPRRQTRRADARARTCRRARLARGRDERRRRRGRQGARACDRPARDSLHLRRTHEEGNAVLASRARRRALLAASRPTGHAAAVEIDCAGLKG